MQPSASLLQEIVSTINDWPIPGGINIDLLSIQSKFQDKHICNKVIPDSH